MFERNRRAPRFKTPPDRPKTKESGHRDSSEIIDATQSDTEKRCKQIFHEEIKSIQDALNLINLHPEITLIRWLKIENELICFVLFSFNPTEKGWGGCSITENEFEVLKKNVPPRIKIEYVKK